MVGQKILVVDDEHEVVELLSKMLINDGFDVIKAFEGEEAVDKAIRETPDLILLDIVLPDFDGSEVLQQIRSESPVGKKTPVIFLSGIISEDESDEKATVTVGGQSYLALPKPVPYSRLLSEIKKSLLKQ